MNLLKRLFTRGRICEGATTNDFSGLAEKAALVVLKGYSSGDTFYRLVGEEFGRSNKGCHHKCKSISVRDNSYVYIDVYILPNVEGTYNPKTTKCLGKCSKETLAKLVEEHEILEMVQIERLIKAEAKLMDRIISLIDEVEESLNISKGGE